MEYVDKIWLHQEVVSDVICTLKVRWLNMNMSACETLSDHCRISGISFWRLLDYENERYLIIVFG